MLYSIIGESLLLGLLKEIEEGFPISYNIKYYTHDIIIMNLMR